MFHVTFILLASHGEIKLFKLFAFLGSFHSPVVFLFFPTSHFDHFVTETRTIRASEWTKRVAKVKQVG